MADKKKKLIERWLMDNLQREKNDKVFLCNEIAQRISEIFGIFKIFLA